MLRGMLGIWGLKYLYRGYIGLQGVIWGLHWALQGAYGVLNMNSMTWGVEEDMETTSSSYRGPKSRVPRKASRWLLVADFLMAVE